MKKHEKSDIVNHCMSFLEILQIELLRTGIDLGEGRGTRRWVESRFCFLIEKRLIFKFGRSCFKEMSLVFGTRRFSWSLSSTAKKDDEGTTTSAFERGELTLLPSLLSLSLPQPFQLPFPFFLLQNAPSSSSPPFQPLKLTSLSPQSCALPSFDTSLAPPPSLPPPPCRPSTTPSDPPCLPLNDTLNKLPSSSTTNSQVENELDESSLLQGWRIPSRPSPPNPETTEGRIDIPTSLLTIGRGQRFRRRRERRDI